MLRLIFIVTYVLLIIYLFMAKLKNNDYRLVLESNQNF